MPEFVSQVIKMKGKSARGAKPKVTSKRTFELLLNDSPQGTICFKIQDWKVTITVDEAIISADEKSQRFSHEDFAFFQRTVMGAVLLARQPGFGI
jgi:hypothetical protein